MGIRANGTKRLGHAAAQVRARIGTGSAMDVRATDHRKGEPHALREEKKGPPVGAGHAKGGQAASGRTVRATGWRSVHLVRAKEQVTDRTARTAPTRRSGPPERDPAAQERKAGPNVRPVRTDTRSGAMRNGR